MFLAHAFGQRYDLPIPLLLYVLGGATVVVASFALVLPRAVGRDPEPLAGDGPDGPGLSPGLSAGEGSTASPPLRFAVPGVVSVLLLAALVACGLLGSQETAENILPTLFWLVVWIAVPLSCGLLGDWTRPVNPFAFLARAADRPGARALLLGGERPLKWPRKLGWWPAVALYFGAACGELVFNVTATVPAHIAWALICYAVVSAAGGLLYGRAWLDRGELFTVLFDTWGRLGWFRFGAEGRRGFARGLDRSFSRSPSRVVFVLLLLISVNFDGLLATPKWNRLELRMPGQLAAHTQRLELFRTATFVGLALAITALFGAFAVASSRAGRHRTSSGGALAGLLPSLLPIAFGYLLAHNLQYLVVNAQLLFPLIGNPTGLESWPLHLGYPFNDDFEPHLRLLPTAFYWYVSVATIIVVHVVAVVLAHRHLGRRGESVRAARSSEYPWLVAMVAYTMLSLWLIAQPLVREEQHSRPESSPAAADRVPAGADRAAPAGTGGRPPAAGTVGR